MSQMLDLDQIERKIWTRTFQDGLLDIYLGLILVAVGISGITLRTDLPAPWPLVIYFILAACCWLLWAGSKRFITAPRLGHVKPGPKAKARRSKMAAVGFVSVSLTSLILLLSIVAWNSGVSRDDRLFHILAQTGVEVSLLLAFGLGAYFMEFDRMYVIGLLYAFGVGGLLLYVMEDMSAGIYMTFAAAAAVTIMGIVIFIRFLHNHPVPIVGEPHGEQ